MIANSLIVLTLEEHIENLLIEKPEKSLPETTKKNSSLTTLGLPVRVHQTILAIQQNCLT
jgi:hypothetical protein